MNVVKARVLLIDDDIELASLMTEFLSSQGFELGAAHNGADGLREALTGMYDIVLLDVMMPQLDGFEVLRRLREQSRIPVIMLTARTESASRIKGLEGGADDYLPKPFEPLELVARIRAVLRRVRSDQDSEGPLEVSGVRLDPSSRRVSVRGEFIDLTTIEYDILEALMRSAGRVVSRDDLMLRLYNRESTPYDRSIDVHISHLRKKLEPAVELIRTIRGVGYQFAIEEAKAN